VNEQRLLLYESRQYSDKKVSISQIVKDRPSKGLLEGMAKELREKTASSKRESKRICVERKRNSKS